MRFTKQLVDERKTPLLLVYFCQIKIAINQILEVVYMENNFKNYRNYFNLEDSGLKMD